MGILGVILLYGFFTLCHIGAFCLAYKATRDSNSVFVGMFGGAVASMVGTYFACWIIAFLGTPFVFVLYLLYFPVWIAIGIMFSMFLHSVYKAWELYLGIFGRAVLGAAIGLVIGLVLSLLLGYAAICFFSIISMLVSVMVGKTDM